MGDSLPGCGCLNSRHWRRAGTGFAHAFDVVGPGQVVSAISKYNTLSPGDVIWLGTDEVPQNLLAGDVIEIEINGIGVLRNRVAAEAQGEAA